MQAVNRIKDFNVVIMRVSKAKRAFGADSLIGAKRNNVGPPPRTR